MRDMLEGFAFVRTMKPRFRLGAWMLALMAIFGTSQVFAQSKDDLALKLDQDAIENDYLAMKFVDAEKKLRQAIAVCGRTGCSQGIVAQLHRDLGIIYVVSNRPE